MAIRHLQVLNILLAQQCLATSLYAGGNSMGDRHLPLLIEHSGAQEQTVASAYLNSPFCRLTRSGTRAVGQVGITGSPDTTASCHPAFSFMVATQLKNAVWDVTSALKHAVFSVSLARREEASGGRRDGSGVAVSCRTPPLPTTTPTHTTSLYCFSFREQHPHHLISCNANAVVTAAPAPRWQPTATCRLPTSRRVPLLRLAIWHV